MFLVFRDLQMHLFQVLFELEVPGGGCAPIDSLLGPDLSG